MKGRLSNMYAIHATVEHKQGGWTAIRQVPTFYLNENVQGILTEHQARIVAEDILSAACDATSLARVGVTVDLHVTAVKL